MHLAETTQGKIIPTSYASIQHLRGSKMIDDKDKLLDVREELWITEKIRTQKDLVIVTEKVDGCNVGVLKRDGKLYPILRRGYDVRTNSLSWIRDFAGWVEENEERFYEMLNDDERVCGEWLVKTHTLEYRMKHEPFVVFDMIIGYGKDMYRNRYENIASRARGYGFTTAGLVHMGGAIEPVTALKIMGEGYHGVQGQPEGVVYRYEDENGFKFSAKYVSNPLVGNNEVFRENIDSNKMNKWRIYKQPLIQTR